MWWFLIYVINSEIYAKVFKGIERENRRQISEILQKMNNYFAAEVQIEKDERKKLLKMCK